MTRLLIYSLTMTQC